jgi:hypothetical protein
VVECAACGGLWLSQDHFEVLCDSAEARERASADLRARPQVPSVSEGQPLRYLPCVACGELMNRRNYASISGVVIDVCRKPASGSTRTSSRMARLRARRGLGRSREREIERLREERRRQRLRAGRRRRASASTRRAASIAERISPTGWSNLVQRLWG